MNVNRKIKSVFIILTPIIGGNGFAQDHTDIPSSKTSISVPINAEIFGTNRGLAFQMIMDKKFQTIPKLGIFSVTSLVGEWNDNKINDYMTQSSLTYEVIKGLRFTGGFHVTPVKAMRPIAGILYTVATPTFLFVATSRIDFSKDTNLEGLVLFEYKPKINDQWNFYSKIQALYEYSTVIDLQTRSYFIARAGLSYKEFSFGLGSNIDYYGPEKHKENSFGGFISFLIF